MNDFDPTAFGAGAAGGAQSADQPDVPAVGNVAGSVMSFMRGVLDPQSVAAKPTQPAAPSAVMSFMQGVLDPSTKAPQMISSAVQGEQPFESLAPHLEKMGVDLPRAQQQYGLEQARSKYSNAEEDTLRYVARRAIPGFSAAYKGGQDYRVKRALDRFKDGKADQQDLEMIAQHERLAEIDRGRSTGEAVVSSLAKVPAILGEMAAAGPLLSRVPGGLAGRSLAMPAVVPSLGAGTGAIERAIQQGGSPLNPKNLAPAYGQAALSAAILGSLQNPVMGIVPTRVGRAAVGGPLATIEQQAADAIQSKVDEFLPEAYKSHTDYGLLGDLAKGKEGEAIKKATVQTLTFAAFAALHGKPTKPLIDLTQRILADAKKADVPPDLAMSPLAPARRAYEEAKARDPNISRQDVEDLAKQFDGPGREELELLAVTHEPRASEPSPVDRPDTSPAAPADGIPPAAGGEPPVGNVADTGQARGSLVFKSAKEVRSIAENMGLPTDGTHAEVISRIRAAEDAKSPRIASERAAPEPVQPAAEPEIAPEAATQKVSGGKSFLGDVIDAAGVGGRHERAASDLAGEGIAVLGYGDRFVSIQHKPDVGRVRVDFDYQDSNKHNKAVPSELSRGSMEIGRDLRKVVGVLRDKGVGVEYSAEPRRDAAYSRMLQQMGFRLESKKTTGGSVEAVWNVAGGPERPLSAGRRERFKSELEKAMDARLAIPVRPGSLGVHDAQGPLAVDRPPSPVDRADVSPLAKGDGLPGKATTLSIEGGKRTIAGQYVVKEIGDVVASHKAEPPYTFVDRVKTGEYPSSLQPRDYSTDKTEQAKVVDQARRLEPTAMLAEHPDPGAGPPTISREGNVAINGNGRQMMLERSRDLGTYEPYKAALIERAGLYGVDPAAVAKMKEPALYRVVDMAPGSKEAQQFAREGNQPIGKMQSIERQAATHADLIDDGVLRKLRLEGDETFSQAVTDKTGGRSFRQALYERMPANVRDLLFDASDPTNIPLTEAGKLYVSNMMLSKILPIELIEGLGADRRRVLNNVEGSIPQLMKFRVDRPEFDVTPQILEALGFMGRNPDVKDAAGVNDALDQLSWITGKQAESISPGGRMMLDFLMQGNGTKQFRSKLVKVLNGERQGLSLTDILMPPSSAVDPIENIAALLGVKYRRGATFGAMKEMRDVAQTLALNGRSQQAIEEGIRQTQGEALQPPGAGEPDALPGPPAASHDEAASAGGQRSAARGEPPAAVGNVADRQVPHAVSDPQFQPDLSRASPAPAGAVEQRNGSGLDGIAKATLDFLKGESGHYWVPSYEAIRETIAKATRYVKDETDKWAGKIAPKLTRLARAVGEKLGEYVAVADYVEKALPRYLDQVLGEKITPEERHLWGTVATEWQLQHTAAAYRERAARESDEGERASLTAAADGVRSVIGPDSPIKSQADYLALLRSPEFLGILKRYKAHFVPDMEARFKQAMGLEDASSIDSFTQVPGFPMNLKAAKIGEAATAVPTTHAGEAAIPQQPGDGPSQQRLASPRAGNLKNMRVSRLGASRQRKGDAEAYDTDIAAMLESSLRTSYRLAKKADLMRTAIAEGVAQAGPERSKIEFDGQPAREIPGVFTRGTPEGKEGKTSLFIHPDGYAEMRQALEVDERTNWPVMKALNGILTKAALMSTVEAAYHGKNLLTFLMNPGVAPIRDLLPNVYRILRNNKETQGKLLELARIGAAKEKGFDTGVLWGGKTDPTVWGAKFLDILDNSMRLTANDAFNRLLARRNPLTGKPLVENTQTNRRDFINQLGQYKKAAQAKLTVFLRDSGLGPFATAGMNYMVQSARALTMNPGVKGTSTSSDVMLRTEKLAKAIGLLAATAVSNYLLWGRADGDDSTPLGGLKVGEGKGKTSYVNIGSLVGVSRGLRETGLLAVVEGQRKGEKAGVTADHAAEDVFHAIMHPAAGPGVATAYTAISGRNTLGTRVAGSPRTAAGEIDPTGSQEWENLKAALRNANPLYAQSTGFNKPPTVADERAHRTIGELTAARKTLEGQPTAPGRPVAAVPVEERAMQLLGPFRVQTRKKLSFAEQRNIEEGARRRRMGER